MNIMFLGQWYAPEEVSTAIYTTELATDLVKHGHQVTFVTGAPNYPYGKVFKGYKNPIYQVEWIEGVRVVRIWSYITPGKRFWPRIFNYGTYSASSLYGGLLAGKPDVLISYTPPLPLGISAWMLARIWRVPWVVHIEDLYPDAAISAGYLKDRTSIRFFYAMERFIYRQATHINVVAENFCRNLTRKGIAPEKISTVPVWADPDLVFPAPKENNFRKEHGLEGKFVILYAGNLGVTSCLDDVLYAAEMLKDDPDIRFVLVGDGVKKESYQNIVNELGLDNTQFLPFQPRSLFCEMLAAADMSVVTLHPDQAESSLPSKVFNFMASARPILAVAPPESELSSVVNEAACGITFPSGNPGQIAETIRQLKGQESRLEEMGQNGRALLEKKYVRSRCVGIFEEILTKICKADKGGKKKQAPAANPYS